MTTVTARSDRHAELRERTRAAWTAYHDELRELTGQAYVDAETRAWEQLQGTLRRLQETRADEPVAEA